MKRSRSLLVAIAAFLALLVGFGSRSDAAPSAAGQTVPLVRVGFQNGFSSYDLFRAQSGAQPTALKLSMETLVAIGDNGKPQLWLAKSVKVLANGLNYTFTLRKGIRFWNGNELTAADVANALNYYRAPGSLQAAGFGNVRTVQAKGRYTVVIKLKRRDAGFLADLAYRPGIFERKFQQEHGADMGKPGIFTMATGPWRPTSLDPTQSVELVAYPNYWRGRPPVQRISLKFIPDPTAQALAFRAGEIDLVPGVPGRRAFEATAGVKLPTYPDCATTFFSLNTQHGPWSDIHVRRATMYAMNKKEIIQSLGPDAVNTDTMIHRTLLETLASKKEVDQLLKSLPKYPFSLAKARAELRQSKYPNGFTSELTMIPFAQWPEMSQVLAAQLNRIGIKLQIKNVTFGEWSSQTFGFPKPDIFLTAYGCPADAGNMPKNIVHTRQAKRGGGNNAEYRNPRADALVDAGLKATDPAARFKIYSELEAILARDLPYVNINSTRGSYAVGGRFSWKVSNGGWWTSPWLLDLRSR